jgi:hypothetical protein
MTIVVQASLPACRTLDECVTIELRASSLRRAWFPPRRASWAAKDAPQWPLAFLELYVRAVLR